jgi:1-deoxy-D-xylulose-5-phosphate synthase
MVRFALAHTGPISVRYPKANLETVDRVDEFAPIELGKAEVVEWGEDGCFVAFGTLLSNCVAGGEEAEGEGIHMGVINARFVKPLDKETILRAVEPFRWW